MLHVDSLFTKKMKVILGSFIVVKIAEDNRLYGKVTVFTIFKTTKIYYISLS